MEKLQILQIFLLFCYSVKTESFEDLSAEKWLNHNYLLKWKTDNTAKSISLRVEVKTKGWIGFGFSKHGLTNEADIVFGWVDSNGKPTLKDFWVSESFTRYLDSSQDWHLITASENETHTVLEFCRKYITCDSEHDIEIFENEFERSNIVFSYGLTDPINIESIGDPFFEDVIHLNLFFPEDFYEPKENDIQVFDYQMNVTLPSKRIHDSPNVTYCKLFKYQHNDKRTLVKTIGIVLPLSKIPINHHIALLRCPKGDPSIYEKNLGQVFHCYDYKANNLRTKCGMATLLLSVKSQDAFSFPIEAGLSLDPDDSPYFLIESHLLNPTFEPIDASSTVRMWTTGKKRKYEAQFKVFSTTLGVYSSNWGYIVPPKQLAFKIVTVHDTYCLEKVNMGKNGVFIFAVLFHTHQAKSQEARHYRNDKLQRVFRYNHYDSDYQPWVVLKKTIHLLKGDKFVVTCEVNTINETRSYTTPREHCNFLIFIYPKQELYGESTFWARIPYQTILNITGVQQIDNYDNGTIDDIVIRKPVQFNNTKLVDFVGDNKYRVNDPKQLEMMLISAEMEQFCSVTNHSKIKDGRTNFVTKPPGLYEQLDNWRVQNTCPFDNGLSNSDNQRVKSEPTLFGFQSLNQLKLSFGVIMKSFKMSFALLV